jgi:hypothetical protein
MSAGGAKADVRKYNVSTLINKVATKSFVSLLREPKQRTDRGAIATSTLFEGRLQLQHCSTSGIQYKSVRSHTQHNSASPIMCFVTPVKDCIQVVVTSSCKSEQLYLSQQASKAFQKTKRWRLTDTQSSYLPHNFHQHQFVSCCALLFQTWLKSTTRPTISRPPRKKSKRLH